jgi:hypothetical protein
VDNPEGDDWSLFIAQYIIPELVIDSAEIAGQGNPGVQDYAKGIGSILSHFSEILQNAFFPVSRTHKGSHSQDNRRGPVLRIYLRGGGTKTL